jgi:hypothetical protein
MNQLIALANDHTSVPSHKARASMARHDERVHKRARLALPVPTTGSEYRKMKKAKSIAHAGLQRARNRSDAVIFDLDLEKPEVADSRFPSDTIVGDRIYVHFVRGCALAREFFESDEGIDYPVS